MRDLRSKQLANDINETRNSPRRVHQIVGDAIYI